MKSKRQKQIEARERRIVNLRMYENKKYASTNPKLEANREYKIKLATKDIDILNIKLGMVGLT